MGLKQADIFNKESDLWFVTNKKGKQAQIHGTEVVLRVFKSTRGVLIDPGIM